ncbi:nucleoside deaminase [Streptomyces sp. NPDC046261]|uniref:nucleoside deaminase n=1 Tax=Streptomyces sp. NPDC046261 TaxID=3157200 RepID=UPI0033D8E862
MSSRAPSRRRFLCAAATAAPLSLGGALPRAHAHGRADADWTGEWPPSLRAAVLKAMPVAVRHARASAKWPFGAVLVDAADGDVVAGAGNTSESGDPTAHAEVNVLRSAASGGLHLPGHVLVSTAEPCPMCAGALLWGGVRAVAYGTSIAKLVAWGLPQIEVPLTEVVRASVGLPRPSVARDVRAEITDPLYRDLARTTRPAGLTG